eukprot:Opistho-1_new@73020
MRLCRWLIPFSGKVRRPFDPLAAAALLRWQLDAGRVQEALDGYAATHQRLAALAQWWSLAPIALEEAARRRLAESRDAFAVAVHAAWALFRSGKAERAVEMVSIAASALTPASCAEDAAVFLMVCGHALSCDASRDNRARAWARHVLYSCAAAVPTAGAGAHTLSLARASETAHACVAVARTGDRGLRAQQFDERAVRSALAAVEACVSGTVIDVRALLASSRLPLPVPSADGSDLATRDVRAVCANAADIAFIAWVARSYWATMAEPPPLRTWVMSMAPSVPAHWAAPRDGPTHDDLEALLWEAVLCDSDALQLSLDAKGATAKVAVDLASAGGPTMPLDDGIGRQWLALLQPRHFQADAVPMYSALI